MFPNSTSLPTDVYTATNRCKFNVFRSGITFLYTLSYVKYTRCIDGFVANKIGFHCVGNVRELTHVLINGYETCS
jgi:hypothetical protein